MNETEVKCFRCGSKTRVCFYPPLSDLSMLLNAKNTELQDFSNKQSHCLSDLLRINEELGEQNQKMKGRIETFNDFMETVFGENIDMVTLWQMSEIVSRIENLKHKEEE